MTACLVCDINLTFEIAILTLFITSLHHPETRLHDLVKCVFVIISTVVPEFHLFCVISVLLFYCFACVACTFVLQTSAS